MHFTCAMHNEKKNPQEIIKFTLNSIKSFQLFVFVSH